MILLFRLDCNLNRVLRQWGAIRPIWFELGEWLVGIGLLPSHVLLCEGWNAYRTATACSERLHAGAATCVLLVYIYIYEREWSAILIHCCRTNPRPTWYVAYRDMITALLGRARGHLMVASTCAACPGITL